MRIGKLFSPVRSADADELRAYMASHDEGTYTLLDVRQPGEYEKEHIPGAKLVPLAQLTEAATDMDPDKPVYVY